MVDYNTGTNLEVKNKYKVTVKNSGWKYYSKKTYYDYDGCSIWLKKAKIKLTITYPKTYKGLCIGVGGSATLNQTDADHAFWNGTKTFIETDMYKKNKKGCKFMRVTK